MKQLFGAICLALFLASCVSTGPASGLKLRDYSDTTLKNGLQVLTIEDHSLPFISVGLLIRTGTSQDPLSKSGLAELTAELLERGSKNHSATELADGFGALGTSFSADADYDFVYLSTSGLAENQNELLKLFFEVVMTPAFNDSEVDRLKGEKIADIQRSYDQPGYVANRLYSQLLFGAYPYGRSPSGTVRDVQSIKTKDVLDYYSKVYRPNNSMLVLVGDLEKNMVGKLNAQLSDWQSGKVSPDAFPSLHSLQGVRIQLANRADLKQSEVRIGHYGIKRNISDYLPLTVAETILSGGFTSRLMREIRVKRGLTYGIGSSFDARKEIGPFTISTNTRHDKVGELVRETLATVNGFYEKGVTQEEVDIAKGYLRGTFPRRIETSEQLARMLVGLRFYGVGDDYMTNYMSHLNKITAADVNAVIKKYYHPSVMRVFVYGPKDLLLDQLRPIGTVEVKNYQELL